MNKQQKIERAYEEMGGELKLSWDGGGYIYRSDAPDYQSTHDSEFENAYWKYVCTKQEFEEYAATRTISTNEANNVNGVSLTLETTIGASSLLLHAENLSQETALAMQKEWANEGQGDSDVDYVELLEAQLKMSQQNEQNYVKLLTESGNKKKRHIAIIAHPQQFEYFIKNLGGRYSQSQSKLITEDTVYYHILPTSSADRYAGLVLHAVLSLTSVNWVLERELHKRVFKYEEQ